MVSGMGLSGQLVSLKIRPASICSYQYLIFGLLQKHKKQFMNLMNQLELTKKFYHYRFTVHVQPMVEKDQLWYGFMVVLGNLALLKCKMVLLWRKVEMLLLWHYLIDLEFLDFYLEIGGFGIK